VTNYTITRARVEHVPQIPRIELAAAQLLRGHAPDAVLHETSSAAELADAVREGRIWVAQADDIAVGFALVQQLDSMTAHLEEIDVLPAHGRRGLGTRLVMTVCDCAAARHFERVTLTTFRDVPWNMPFYAKLGFDVVPPAQLSESLQRRVDDEARRGLDPLRRVVMSINCAITRRRTGARATCSSASITPRRFG
jgi:GNAT superfamily N-acetyltransferase